MFPFCHSITIARYPILLFRWAALQILEKKRMLSFDSFSKINIHGEFHLIAQRCLPTYNIHSLPVLISFPHIKTVSVNPTVSQKGIVYTVSWFLSLDLFCCLLSQFLLFRPSSSLCHSCSRYFFLLHFFFFSPWITPFFPFLAFH